jgi:hypothetical protein
MAVLRNCSIRFHTTDNDKDGDTHVTVNVFDSNNVLAAHVDSDFGHFDDNSDNGPFQLIVQNPSTNTALQSGRLDLRIDPNGHDTWHFNFLLDLVFDDNSHLSGGADGISLDQDNRTTSFGLSGLVH